MKKDLISSIGLAIIGAVIAFFVCNLLIPPIEDFSFKTIDSSVNTNIVEPSPEVFNYKAINPTVEVYVGDCTELNDYGECIEQSANGAAPATNQGNN